MRPNRLRERLRAGRPTLGTHIHSAWPAVVELAGHAGCFDYVEFVGEYAPYDLFALENLARAVNTFDHMSAMFKVEQQPRTYLAVRAIGAGIQNLLFADPRTPDDVRECVRSVRAETQWRTRDRDGKNASTICTRNCPCVCWPKVRSCRSG